MVLDRSRIANHAAVSGAKTDHYVFLSPNETNIPTDEILTAATGGASKGATTITVDAATTNKLLKGQALQFYDEPTGAEILCVISADVAAGETELTVEEIAREIPAGATAVVPPYLWDRSASDLSRSADFSATTGYNDDKSTQAGVITGGSKSLAIPGRYSEENAAARTMVYAHENGIPVHVTRILSNPNTDIYQSGRTYKFRALVTDAPQASPNENNVSEDFTLTIIGRLDETAPTPVA